jgi:hypothetical protein
MVKKFVIALIFSFALVDALRVCIFHLWISILQDVGYFAVALHLGFFRIVGDLERVPGSAGCIYGSV